MNKMEAQDLTNSNGIVDSMNAEKKYEDGSVTDKKDRHECGQRCKMKIKELEEEVHTLRNRVEVLTRLNHGLQEDVIAKFKDFHFQKFIQANTAAPNDDVPTLPPVATRKNGQVHLGRDVWIPIQIFDSISSKKASKDGLFIKDMAVAVFGEVTLSKSSVTGAISNRCLNKPKKPPLDPTKKMAICDILRHRLEQRKESEENIAKALDTVNSTIAEKIQDLIRPPRKQKVADYDDTSQQGSPRIRPDGNLSLPATFLGLESRFAEASNKALQILQGPEALSRIPITSIPARTTIAENRTGEAFSSNGGNPSFTDPAFGVPGEDLVIPPQEPGGSLGRFDDPLSLRMDGVTVKNEDEQEKQCDKTNPIGDNNIVFVSDIAGSNNEIFSPSLKLHTPISSTNEKLVAPDQDVTIKRELDESFNSSSGLTATADVPAQYSVIQNELLAERPCYGTVPNESSSGIMSIDSDLEETSWNANVPVPVSDRTAIEKRTISDYREEDMLNPQLAIEFYRLATRTIVKDDVLYKNQLLIERVRELEVENKCLKEKLPNEGSLKRKAEGEGREIKTKERHRDQIILLRRPSKPTPPS